MRILDQFGTPIVTQPRELNLRAKFDAAQTVDSNEMHWSMADHLDPHAVASLGVRKTLRSRSRYECLENNPYLLGTLLTIANDFVGTGPKYRVTDERLTREGRRLLEKKRRKWGKAIKLRKLLWRSVLAKKVDGETFLRVYANRRTLRKTGLSVNFQILETDQISHFTMAPKPREVDGVRFDRHENPTHFHVLHQHPGSDVFFMRALDGRWVNERFMTHWFRQTRGWLRGIPETTPSLPLCALLRRYTLAVVQHKEVAANLTAILETAGPARITAYAQEHAPDLFDTFPIEKGMMVAMPHRYQMKQLNAVPDGVQFDEFTGALLREITRPLLTPFNIVAGTSKDSNMASAVVDTHIYKGGIGAERIDCEDEFLERVDDLWWWEATLNEDYLSDLPLEDQQVIQEQMRGEQPEHEYSWDKVGLDHTDPAKVMKGMEIAHQNGFISDRDVQETHYNRNVETWQEDMREQKKFRAELGLENAGTPPEVEEEDQEEDENEEN